MEQLLDLVHESVRDSLRGLISEDIRAPEVGYELQNGDGEIIADGELAWVAEKLVVLVTGQESCRKKFEDAGWTAISGEMEGGWVDSVRATLMERINA